VSDASDRLFGALAIPDVARVDRRVAKSMLVERGDLTSADRKAIEAGVDRLNWRATLTPKTVGLPALQDDARDYSQMVVMTVVLREGAKADRVAELIHRAIAHPLTLIVEAEGSGRLTVGLKRRHEREAGRVVVERLIVGPTLGQDDPVESGFLDSLNLAATGAADLWTLHTRWGERVEAFSAAGITGRFRPPVDSQDAERRREALVQYGTAARDLDRLRKRARSERQLNRRITLANEVALLEVALERIAVQIA
jgi:hypothetical protein